MTKRHGNFCRAIIIIGTFVAIVLSATAFSRNLSKYSPPPINSGAFYNVNVKLTPAVTYCVHLVYTQPGYGHFQNNCAFDVVVQYFDQGNCKGPCSLVVYANGVGEILYTGLVRYGACKLGEGIVDVGARFECRIYGATSSQGTEPLNPIALLKFRQPVNCNCPGPDGPYLAKSGIVIIKAGDLQSAIVKGRAAASAFCGGVCPPAAQATEPVATPPFH